MVKVPFEVELAKKITNGEVEGKVVTRNGRSARVICFDAHSDDNIIALIQDEKGVEYPKSYVSDGMMFLTEKCDCDLMLEIPEYKTFKDGDILCCKGVYNWIFIYRSNGCDKTSCYAAVMDKSSAVFLGFCVMSDEEVKDLRLATEQEKQKLIEVLKSSKEPKAKEYLKRFFNIEVKSKCDFKVGQPVIGIDGRGEWRYDLFSHYKPEYRNGNYVCSARSYSTCLPYNDQKKHLLGTTEDYKGD